MRVLSVTKKKEKGNNMSIMDFLAERGGQALHKLSKEPEGDGGETGFSNREGAPGDEVGQIPG